MINQDILFYIKEQLRAGASREAIRSVLVDRGGWNPVDVDEALSFIANPSGRFAPAGAPQPAPSSSLVQQPREIFQPQQPTSPWGNTQAAPSQPVFQAQPVTPPTAAQNPWQQPAAAPAPAQPAPLPQQPQSFQPQPVASPMNYGGYAVNQVQMPAEPKPMTPIQPLTPVQPVMSSAPLYQAPQMQQPTAAPMGARPISQYQPIARTETPSTNPGIYAPTHVGEIPHFVGMPAESDVVIRERGGGSGKRIFKMLGIIILILAMLAGGYYAYVTYFNPSSGAVLGASFEKFGALTSYRYNVNIEAEATLSSSGRDELKDFGVVFPPDFGDETKFPLSIVLSGGVTQSDTGATYTTRYSIETQESAGASVSMRGEGVVSENLLHIKTDEIEGAEELNEIFAARQPLWLTVPHDEEITQDLPGEIIETLDIITRSPAVFEALTHSGALSVTSELPEGDDAGTPVRRFQFSLVSSNIDAALAALAPHDLPARFESILKTLVLTDGEVWLGKRDMLLRKVSFKVRTPEPIGSLSAFSAQVTATISDYNTTLTTPMLSSAESYVEHQQNVAIARRDTSVKNTLSTTRAIAESYYSKKKSYAGFCTSPDDLGAKSLIVPLEGLLGTGTVVCASTAKTFVIAAPISNSQYFCVDNLGSAIARDTKPTLSCQGE